MNTVMERDLVTDMAKFKAREVVNHIEFLRRLRRLHEELEWPQTRLADANKVSQPTISQWLKRARVDAPDLRPGTHGGTPYEIAAKYAAQLVDRATMLKELSEWVYGTPEPAPSEEGDLRPLNLAGFNLQVGRALDDQLINDSDYEAILEAVAD